jgi:flagellar motility protein MotE (MotC chaperone)
MKLSEYLSQGTFLHKKGKLKIDISLDNGEVRYKDDIVSILMDKGNGNYHAEDNGWACTVKEVKEKCQVGDYIVTKQGYIGNSANIKVPLGIVVTKIEEKGNSIRLYFDLNKLQIFNDHYKKRYEDAKAQAKSNPNNPNYLKQTIGNVLGYTVANGYITASAVERIDKNPMNVKPTKSRLNEKIREHENKIKKLLSEIENEKEQISDLKGKIDFINKFNLTEFNDKKYKAYRLVQTVSKMNHTKITSDILEEVAKIV